jgi:uncharacterized protein YprB with RNaseH-like and TPR domain
VTDVLDRLRQLRKQAGAAPSAARLVGVETVRHDAPDLARPEVPEQIRRLLGIRARTLPPRVQSSDRQLPGREIAPGLYYRESLAASEPVPAQINAGFARLGMIPSADLMHFDTETTGLSGGTGTRAFMIGVGDWFDGGLRLRQLTIATMAAETAMLQTFAGWLAPGTVLVSYNGKCYDAPLLNTRYRLARLPSPLPACGHLDLLHPSRRHWKGRWENCRLGTIERQVLGIVREDDLPGSEAPRAWRDYLRGGSARDLRRVAEHNAQDLRSLAGLCLRLSALADAPADFHGDTDAGAVTAAAAAASWSP